MPSFYVNFTQTDKVIDVYEEEFHHIHRVFRHKDGDLINIVNGFGLYATAEITNINKKYLRLNIKNVEYKKKSARKIACAFSLLKNKNDLLVIEKLTELGVNEFFPMQTRYSVRQSKETTNEKFEKIAISAIKQCDNPYLPDINNVSNLDVTLSKIIAKGYIPIIASERENELFLSELLSENQENDFCMVIGPEGGFSDEEFELFYELNIKQVSIGNHILRAETAAISAISQLVFAYLKNDKYWF
ncbi:MAG: 16S rRNA (uracil(1498)-N(3))-methyltransferase [Candidatus Cloacimonetes bacterium]|nr:16S rRNA (uracil(1498)-N(3))-methyltransferase [Candidatus Cloacimonadota bacterium]